MRQNINIDTYKKERDRERETKKDKLGDDI